MGLGLESALSSSSIHYCEFCRCVKKTKWGPLASVYILLLLLFIYLCRSTAWIPTIARDKELQHCSYQLLADIKSILMSVLTIVAKHSILDVCGDVCIDYCCKSFHVRCLWESWLSLCFVWVSSIWVCISLISFF